MRSLEVITLIGLAIILLSYAWPVAPRPKGFRYFFGLVLAFLAAHLLIEKGRWQMLPMYGLTLALVILEFHIWRQGSSSAVSRGALAGKLAASFLKGLSVHLAWLLWLAALALGLLFPVFELPKPGGPYAIGTQDLHFIDKNRPEKFTVGKNNPRELMVRIWYPAWPTINSTPQPFWPDAHQRAAPMLVRLNLPTFALDHLALVKTHSVLNSPIANNTEQFPVLIFSHGYGSEFSANQTQMEELASHGYIVFSINHTYEALATVFPDGRVIPEDQYIFDNMGDRVDWTLNINDQFSTWVADTTFILDQLNAVQSGEMKSKVTGRLDLDKIGVFGVSYGGATAEEICLVDARCKAGANMDGGKFGYTDYQRSHWSKPFLFFYSEYNEGMNDTFYNRVDNWAYRVTVRGAAHINFGDTALWSPLRRYADLLPGYSLSSSGPIDPLRMIKIENAYLLAFFDRHLKNEDASLLEGPSPDFPEVGYQFRTP
jgi:hypothetical protein